MREAPTPPGSKFLVGCAMYVLGTRWEGTAMIVVVGLVLRFWKPTM